MFDDNNNNNKIIHLAIFSSNSLSLFCPGRAEYVPRSWILCEMENKREHISQVEFCILSIRSSFFESINCYQLVGK